MAKALKLGLKLYATDWRPEGQPTECTVVEANIVNQWDDSKNTYVIEWTDGTRQSIDGPYNAHPLSRTPPRYRPEHPDLVTQRQQEREAARRPQTLARIAAELLALQPTEAELGKLLTKVRG